MVLELARVDLHFALAPQTVVLREASIVKVGALGAGPDQGFELRPAWQLSLGAAPVPLSGVGPRTRLPTEAGASTEFGGAFGNRSLFVFSLVGAHAGALIADRTTFSPLLSWKAGLQVGPADRWTSTLSARCVAVGYSGELLARRGCEGRLDAAVEISRDHDERREPGCLPARPIRPSVKRLSR
jgi:hypothetical protein